MLVLWANHVSLLVKLDSLGQLYEGEPRKPAHKLGESLADICPDPVFRSLASQKRRILKKTPGCFSAAFGHWSRLPVDQQLPSFPLGPGKAQE